jgi:hypothetical protein
VHGFGSGPTSERLEACVTRRRTPSPFREARRLATNSARRKIAENPGLLDVVNCLADLTGARASLNAKNPNAAAVWAVSAPHFPHLLSETANIISQNYRSGARAKVNALSR